MFGTMSNTDLLFYVWRWVPLGLSLAVLVHRLVIVRGDRGRFDWGFWVVLGLGVSSLRDLFFERGLISLSLTFVSGFLLLVALSTIPEKQGQPRADPS